MASPQDASHPLRRKSSANNLTVNKRTETDLSKSLRQLSLSTEAANAGANSQLSPRSPLTRTASSPLYPPSRHASPSPNHRATSRSPSSSVSGERTLLRKASTNSLRSANGMIHGHSSSRRSSFARTMSPTLSTSPDRIPLTAAAVAKGCFQEELDVLHGESSTASTNTVVILNDAVYGHRFSRPRTSKNALSTIVERPERIKAGVLGISMAYVRLGERHCEGGQPPHPKRDVHGMQSVPFKIHKTTRRLPLVSPAVTNVHGTKWMEELKTMCESAEAKLTAGSKELQRPERSRGEPAAEKFHEGDLYLCSESLNAIEGALGAVCEAVDTVFGPGPSRAFVGVRPPGHHCSASHPSGFCWVNNVHVGIMHAAMEHGLTHAAIIDFDLHHGDGSQSIAWQHNKRANTATKNAAPWKKSSIGYFSLHDINSYPCEGGDDEKVKNASLCIDNAHGQSVWNVHLQPYKSEQDFWDLYETKYSILLEKTRNYLRTQYERVKSMKQTPKAAIFFSAGFDASEWEGAGMQRHQVNVPTEFYARLSQDVTKVAEEEGLGVDGRVISVLEGGYSDRALYTGVCSHLSGLVGEQTIPPPRAPSESSSSLGTEMGQRISAVAEEPEETEFASKRGGYDASWWTARELESLEHRMANPEPLPRVIRQQSPGSYASPTQASTAKVVDPANMRRSLSGLGNGRPMSRPSSPPVPDVPWTIATHELCKLLIPTDRQVDSCKAEDLNAEATRARQARQSSVAPPPERGASRMSLRGRKPKTAALEVETTTTVNRRRTVGAPSAAEKASRSVPTTPAKTTARRASRRLSGVPAVPAVPDEPMPQSGPAAPSNTSRAPAPKPELSAAGRSQSGSTINVKKTRPSTAGTGAKREPAGKVTAPPRGSKKLAAVSSRSEVMDSPDPLTAARPATAHGDEMDKLTTGMKKIKINLITKSQKEARERSQQEEAAKAAAALPSSSSTPLAEGNTGPHIDTRLGSPEVEIPSASTSQAGTGDLVSPVESTSDAGRYVPLGGYTASSGVTSPEPDYKPMDTLPGPGTPTIIPQVAIQHSDATDDFIPYQPEGPSPEALTRTEPLKWMPPNINTPAATPSPAKKDQTFKQTSGPIPFGPRQGSSAVKGFQLPASKEAKNGSSL